MNTLPLVVVVVLTSAAGDDEKPWRTFRLPQEVEISLPGDWTLSNEQELREYEAFRDKALADHGFAPRAGPPTARVPFLAVKESDVAATSAMLSVLPGEASQEDILKSREAGIQRIGQALGDAQRKGLLAAGARDISVGAATRVQAGGKTAIYLDLLFTGADNRPYGAAKYFVYTSTRTVVLTLQWTKQTPDFRRKDRDGILASFKVQ